MIRKRKPFGAEIDVELADTFTAYVEHAGHQKYRAIEAALRLFMVADDETQLVALRDKSAHPKELGIDMWPKIGTKDMRKNLRKATHQVGRKRTR